MVTDLDTLKTIEKKASFQSGVTAHFGKFHHAPRQQFPYDKVDPSENRAADFIRKYDGDKPLLLVVCTHPAQQDALFLYTSDQGANWPFAKWCVYDAGLQVPLIARWPGRVKPKSTTDAMVNLVDLLPSSAPIRATTTAVRASPIIAPPERFGPLVIDISRTSPRKKPFS